MTEYQPNSHRSRELQENEPAQKKKVEKVVSGAVKTRDNKGRKFADIFISEDASNVKSYIFLDVLVPAIKKAISDIVTDGIDMILYGGSGRGSRSKSETSRVSYRSYYDDKHDRRDSSSGYGRGRFDYDDIIYETRGEAEKVRNQMLDVIDRYGFVTVGDMYDLSGLTPPYTANSYGWTSIRTAEPVRVRDGYVLKLHKASPID